MKSLKELASRRVAYNIIISADNLRGDIKINVKIKNTSDFTRKGLHLIYKKKIIHEAQYLVSYLIVFLKSLQLMREVFVPNFTKFKKQMKQKKKNGVAIILVW